MRAAQGPARVKTRVAFLYRCVDEDFLRFFAVCATTGLEIWVRILAGRSFHTASVIFTRTGAGLCGAACPSTPEMGWSPANYAESARSRLSSTRRHVVAVERLEGHRLWVPVYAPQAAMT